MPDKYILTNPWIHGDFKPIFKGDTPLEAANEAYKNISKFFGSNMKEYFFTIQKIKNKNNIGNGKNSDYKHFLVSEKRGVNNNKAIKLNLQEINFNKDDNKLLKEFKKELKDTIKDIQNKSNDEQFGGDLFDDDDDDDVYIYDIFTYPKFRSISPLYGYYYRPWLYDRFFTTTYLHFPIFARGYSPYVYISNYRKSLIPVNN